jgi:hypothetical protein
VALGHTAVDCHVLEHAELAAFIVAVPAHMLPRRSSWEAERGTHHACPEEARAWLVDNVDAVDPGARDSVLQVRVRHQIAVR